MDPRDFENVVFPQVLVPRDFGNVVVPLVWEPQHFENDVFPLVLEPRDLKMLYFPTFGSFTRYDDFQNDPKTIIKRSDFQYFDIFMKCSIFRNSENPFRFFNIRLKYQ